MLVLHKLLFMTLVYSNNVEVIAVLRLASTAPCNFANMLCFTAEAIVFFFFLKHS